MLNILGGQGFNGITGSSSPAVGGGGGAGGSSFFGSGGGGAGVGSGSTGGSSNIYGGGGGGGGGAFSPAGGGAGADGIIEVTEYYGNGQVPAFVGSVTSNTTGQERIERAKISVTAAGSSVVQASSNWITPSRLGLGQTAGTISGFSGVPSCTCTVDDPSANADTVCLFYVSTTTTHLEFSAYTPAGGARSDSAVNLICMGPR